MNPRKASEDREKWLEGGGREAGGGEFDDDFGDKVPQFYIYKLPIVRFAAAINNNDDDIDDDDADDDDDDDDDADDDI